jgi:hypothetical protein
MSYSARLRADHGASIEPLIAIPTNIDDAVAGNYHITTEFRPIRGVENRSVTNQKIGMLPRARAIDVAHRKRREKGYLCS